MPISIFSVPETKTTWGRVRIGSVSFIVFRCDVNMRSWKYQNFAASNYAFSLPTAASLKIIKLLYYLGPSSHGDRSGIWKCILSYRHVCIYRHILMSWCDWNGFDDLRIMCGPQCCHQCRRGRSLGAFRAQGQEPPGNKIQPCQKGHISKLPTFKTLCP